MPRPADVLPAMSRSDPGRPRLTAYDDTPGPTAGERVELSARVLQNWVAKAANALLEEFDAGPGTVVRLALPASWRTAYWALATWAVGGCVALDTTTTATSAPADVVVSDDPDLLGAAAAAAGTVLVTLPALARAATGPVPAGALDEARSLAAYPDVLDPPEGPDDDDPALRWAGGTLLHGEVNPAALVEVGTLPPRPRVHTRATDPPAFLGLALAAWAADGSVVLSRGSVDQATLAARLREERVTAER